jgi:hypothetical protein
MPLTSHVELIEQDIKLIVAQELSPVAQGLVLLGVAQAGLVEAKAINERALGHVPEFVTTVNGAVIAWLGLRGLSQIRPDSEITFEFQLWGDLIPFALQSLIDHSPEASGRYKRSWFTMVDGQRVERVEDIPPGVNVILVNDQPYSRKIDTGHMKMSVPPGVVEAARQDILNRFGNSVSVERIMVPLPDGYVLKGRFRKGRGANARRGLRRDTQTGAAMTYPALSISMRA